MIDSYYKINLSLCNVMSSDNMDQQEIDQQSRSVSIPILLVMTTRCKKELSTKEEAMTYLTLG